MEPRRVLIVEAAGDFALQLAAILHQGGFSTTVAHSAAEALRDLEERKPDAVVLRAELPEQSGFVLCARIRRDARFHLLPVVLLSSDSSPEALSEHAAHPTFAASAYLTVPFPLADLRATVERLVPAPLESADDAVIESLGDGDLPEGVEPQRTPIELPSGPPRPPPFPRRERKSALTDEDRSFLDRTFRTIADRKAELLGEARSGPRRSAVPREMLSTPEGKLQLLRDELRSRESQIARVSEIWSVREREMAQVDDRLHEKEVEIQALKLQVDDLSRRITDARESFLRAEREHGESISQLLSERNMQEKEAIEVVASKEKDIEQLRRELAFRDEEIRNRISDVDQLEERISALERQKSALLLEVEVREKQLLVALAGRETLIAGLLSDREAALEKGRSLAAERDARLDEAQAEHRAVVRELSAALDLRDLEKRRLQMDRDEEAARRQLEQAEATALVASLTRERDQAEELLLEQETELSELETAAFGLRRQRDGLWSSLGERLRERDETIARVEAERATERLEAQTREATLSSEVSTQIERVGNLEGEIIALRTEKEEREAELAQEVASWMARMEATQTQLAERVEQVKRLEVALSDLAAERAQSEGELSDALSLARSEAARLTVELKAQGEFAQERESELQKLLQLSRADAAAITEELAGVRAAHAERDEQVSAELGEALSRAADKADQLEALTAQLTAKEQSWNEELERRASVQSELEGRVFSLTAEKQRREAELSRELTARAEVVRNLERKLSEAQEHISRADLEARERAALLGQQLEETTGLLTSTSAERDHLRSQLEELSAARATLEQELRSQLGVRDSRIQDMATQATSERDAARRREDELRAQAARLEGQLATSQAAAAQATEEVERTAAELASLSAARTRKVQELEAALEAALAARGRAERELAQKSGIVDARLADLESRLRGAMGEKRDLEGRTQRQIEDLERRQRSELERREQQKTTEVGRLQAALQEKTRALKVAEIELSRTRGGKPPPRSLTPAAGVEVPGLAKAPPTPVDLERTLAGQPVNVAVRPPVPAAKPPAPAAPRPSRPPLPPASARVDADRTVVAQLPGGESASEFDLDLEKLEM